MTLELSENIQNKIRLEISKFKATLKPNEIIDSLKDFDPKIHKLISSTPNKFYNFNQRQDLKSLGVLEVIEGKVTFGDNDNINNLGNLKYVDGTIRIIGNKLSSLSNLKGISYNLEFAAGSSVTDLGNLEAVGMNAYFRYTNINDLKNLKYIGKDVSFDWHDTNFNLGDLQQIGREIITNNYDVEEKIYQHLYKKNYSSFIRRNCLIYNDKSLIDDTYTDKETAKIIEGTKLEKRMIIEKKYGFSEPKGMKPFMFYIGIGEKKIKFFSNGTITR